MAHVCPWWFCYTFDNPLRKLVHDPVAMLRPYVAPGMTCLDLGCGMGYFSVGLARLTGPGGRVAAVDLQDKMLAGLKRRAARLGLTGIIQPRRCAPDDLGLADLAGAVDFALCFWMLHEVPDQPRFLAQIQAALKPGGRLLISEPRFHVKEQGFAAELDLARDGGWAVGERPAIWGSFSAVLRPFPEAA
jgi:ubiquinone/menaquinone biosynthesis C-methylase UbiE